MPDVEKVIEGLEMSYKYSNVDEENTLVPQWIVLHAIALLKAQEPIAPEPTTDNDWVCGNCAESLVGYSEVDAGGIVTYRFSYCPNCGRAVKWG